MSLPDIPKFPLAHLLDVGQAWLQKYASDLTRGISAQGRDAVNDLVGWLQSLPPWVIIILIGLLAWRIAGRRVAIWSVLGLAFVWNLRLWDDLLQTLVLVLISTFIAILIGLPVGIAAALNRRTGKVVAPILDLMQTMPAFVYLIPAVPFFRLGVVSAAVSTVIFATPPVIRLTTLGIRQVPADLIEAADAFGSTKRQKLFKVQLPMALPSIMAGVNQTIMLALSMVVIAGMIGAGGLGQKVWNAINHLETGAGFESGIAIVILAMVLDRITQHIGQNTNQSK